MASLSQIETWVKTKIRADMGTPTISDLHDTSIATWANEKSAEVIQMLKDTIHFKGLVVIGTSLSITTGSDYAYASFPSDYQKVLAIVVGSSDRKSRLTYDAAWFRRLDSANFVLTPTTDRPVSLIADKVYIKPGTLSSGKIDYVKSHPTIDDSNDTQFSDLADRILTLLIIAEYYNSVIHRADLAANALQEARGLAEDANNSTKSA